MPWVFVSVYICFYLLCFLFVLVCFQFLSVNSIETVVDTYLVPPKHFVTYVLKKQDFCLEILQLLDFIYYIFFLKLSWNIAWKSNLWSHSAMGGNDQVPGKQKTKITNSRILLILVSTCLFHSKITLLYFHVPKCGGREA